MDIDKLTNCDLAEQNRQDELERRAKGAKWKCKECGRASYKNEHLCEPVEI